MPKVAKLGESNQPEGIYIEAGSDGGGESGRRGDD